MAVRRDTICPFCGLGCDDLAVEANAGATIPVQTNCPIADDLFRRSAVKAQARVAGTPTTLEAAIEAATDHLRRSRRPILCGLGTDVAGMGAALTLAERIGGTLDHCDSPALFRNLAVLQRTGWSTTTLAELRNRCDLLIVIGPDPTAGFPRFFERWVAPKPALLEGHGARQIVFLGGEPSERARHQLAGIDLTVIPGPADQLGIMISALRRAVRGDPVESSLLPIARRLAEARYAVLVWAAGLFETGHADLIVESIVRLVREVDMVTRCAGLPLSGADNLLGVNQACAWRTGFPLRTSFAGGRLAHDPIGHAWHRRLSESDAVLWISAFRPELPEVKIEAPFILLAPPEAAPKREPDVLIPVGTPGIDHSGDVFRSDSVVALHAQALVSRGLPSVAHVLKRIMRQLDSRDDAC